MKRKYKYLREWHEREIYRMTLHNYTIKQIATELGVSDSTVRMRLLRIGITHPKNLTMADRAFLLDILGADIYEISRYLDVPEKRVHELLEDKQQQLIRVRRINNLPASKIDKIHSKANEKTNTKSHKQPRRQMTPCMLPLDEVPTCRHYDRCYLAHKCQAAQRFKEKYVREGI